MAGRQDSEGNNYETTSLMASPGRPNGLPTTSAHDESKTSEGTRTSLMLADEMNQPWPSTYERSIELLASPVINAQRVDLLTKSPKPGATPLFGGLFRKSGYKLGRAYQTPDMSFSSAGAAQAGRIFVRPASFGDANDMVRVQSLDFQHSAPSIQQTLGEKDRKAAEAKAYRQKLLKEQQQQLEDGTISPGFRREKSRGLQQKQKAATAGKATFSQCVFNMSNILMGVGMLGLPYVFRSAGWIGGFFVSVVFCLITWWTSVLIGRELNGDPRPSSCFQDSPFESPLLPGSSAEARLRKPLTSFPQIARESFGQRGNFLLSAVLYFELFSCLSIFFVTLGDHLHTLFPNVPANSHRVIISVVLTVPTALLRTPRLLSYLSMVGTFATVAVVLSVFASAVLEGDISEEVAAAKDLDSSEAARCLWRTSGLPLALGLIAYTFSGHAIVPSIYSSMAEPQRFEEMINYTFAIVLGSCLVVAVSGYYMFGGMVEDQITISLEQNSSAGLAMKLLTWLMILTAFSKFTLTMFPLALGVEEIVAPYIPNERVMDVSSSIIKLLLIVAALLVALFVPSFSFICALVGLVCTMTVSVIFPAAAHLKLFGEKLSVGEKFLDWIFIAIGLVVAVVGTIATL